MKALFYLGREDCLGADDRQRESNQTHVNLEWREMPDPILEQTTDAVLEPLAVSMCDLDLNIVRDASPFKAPFVLGHEFVARVVRTGSDVKSLKPDDVVLASFQPSCGHCRPCHSKITSVCQNVPNTSMYGIGKSGGDWSGAMAGLIRVPWADFNLRVLPSQLNAVALASASDNLADGLRCVEAPLLRNPDATVLIVGEGSISLYALLCANHLGTSKVTFASRSPHALSVAEELGANIIAIADWPRKFGSFDVTVDCVNDKQGLQSTIRSTAPFGCFTSASIYFAQATGVPLADMYMKGIELHTGRVNSAGQLDRVIELIAEGLDPNLIQPRYEKMERAIDVLSSFEGDQKLIFTR